MKNLQSIRGMHDVLPGEVARWQWLEARLRALFARYGFQEIRLPTIEFTDVFTRAIGEATDVVEKEMYTFTDRNGDSLSLRPEGTAGVVRAAIQHGLLHTPGLKVWYHGPMFRHERPQRGRQRQFHQFGVEVFGIEAPAIDAEIIALGERMWRELGLSSHIGLEINSLGSGEDRVRYRAALLEYLNDHVDDLDEDSRRRLAANPLRIFDSKVPQTREIMAGAPKLTEHLSGDSAERFAVLREMLENLGIAYRLNPGLVRGLDYYCDTVFEWVTSELGAQGTVCAGGRYDGLVELQGGKPTPGIGFALGVERLVELLALQGVDHEDPPDVYLVCQASSAEGLMLAEMLRDALPDVKVLADTAGGSFKAQFKRADRSKARFALVLGESELAEGMVQVKDLRGGSEQATVPRQRLADHLKSLMDPHS